ncbi:hypothetical protein G3480_04225 [Thiorhodococcus mannitoliphagus]|uniref:Uncharacterized protein n=1 Tax=Thiorhodococcus mannitoliphagus TaxID=329406 RepID=A0A6P1DS54_9GAMM|nr:exosortase H-associated membrane protein [Thiorhodococcus mannitoliphagus]NEX19526.1 hypothetical protein [Thiorhodococcus mannitoliphagus]
MKSLRPFILHTLFWLPVCFGVWYFSSIIFAVPLASLESALLSSLFPDVIDGVVRHGNALTVLTLIEVPTAQGAPAGELLFDLNPLKYGYCVPFYTALVIATPADEAAKLMRWLLGMLILTMVQVFGISTEILKVIAFQLGEQGTSALDFSPWGYEALALAYQLGFLIMPAVVPIMLWLGQFGDTASIWQRSSAKTAQPEKSP